MFSALTAVLASVVTQSVPDSGTTGFLLGAAVIGVGLVARLLKNRKS